LRGKRDINAAIALKLEKALDISAEFWVQLQAEYDLNNPRFAVLFSIHRVRQVFSIMG
jgi:plasmid maintenance system antidote protein VapI